MDEIGITNHFTTEYDTVYSMEKIVNEALIFPKLT
jgi:hypothetical protein